MHIIFGTVILIAVFAVVVRYWITGHWLACSMMMLPAFGLSLVLLELVLLPEHLTPLAAWPFIFSAACTVCVAYAPLWIRKAQERNRPLTGTAMTLSLRD